MGLYARARLNLGNLNASNRQQLSTSYFLCHMKTPRFSLIAVLTLFANSADSTDIFFRNATLYLY